MITGITILVFSAMLLICALESRGQTAKNRFIGALLLGIIGGAVVDNRVAVTFVNIEQR